MIGWYLIVILVILVFVILKYKEIRHKLGFIFVLLIVLFLVVSSSYVYSHNKTDLKTFDGLVSAGKAYFSWFGSLFTNVKDISGYVIKQDWKINESVANLKK